MTEDEVLNNHIQSLGKPAPASNDDVILDRHIKSQAGLQEDNILDNRAKALVKAGPTATVPSSERFGYEFTKDANNIIKNFGLWEDSNLPQWWIEGSSHTAYVDGKLTHNVPDRDLKKKYGEDFYNLTSTERRDRIVAAETASLSKAYPNVNPDETGFAGAVGQLAAAIKDPISYVPFGNTAKAKSLWDFYKAVAPVGALVAGSSTAMHQAARENEMNYWEIGESGLAGALITPLLPYAGSKLVGAISKKLEEVAVNKASELLDTIETRATTKVAQGKVQLEAMEETLKEMGISPKEMEAAMAKVDRGVYIPTTHDAAAEILANAEPVGMRPWKAGSFVDDLIQPISSRIKAITEPVWKRLMQFEMNIHARPYELAQDAQPFFKAIKDLSGELQELAKKAWNNGDLTVLKRILKDDPEALKALTSIRGTLDGLHSELKYHYGYDELTYIKDYLPRLVTDVDGLLSSVGGSKKQGIEKALYDAYVKSGKPLTSVEKADIINHAIRGYPKEVGAPGSTKARTISQVNEGINQFYASPEISFHNYLRRVVTDIEKKEFFGKHIQVRDGTNSIDMEHTIGSFIASDEALLKSPEKLEELRKLLVARFTVGEQAPNKIVAMLRNIGYMSTLGHVTSAVTQLQDIAFTAVREGLGPTLKAMGKGVTGNLDIRAAELGLTKASEELAESSSRSARALDKTLKLVQFERIDEMGKTININAAFNKYTGLAQTEKGIAQIEAKYGQAFGDEFALLVDDLAKNKITDRTKLLMWTELAEIQPISKSEMPLQYLNSPNGRMFYMLQTFTLKQLDYVRRNIYNQMKAGNITEGMSQLAKYSAFLTTAGVGSSALKNFILQKEMSTDDIPMNAVGAFWKNFAGSEITIRKIKQAYDKGEGTQDTIGKMGRAGLGNGLKLAVPILDIASTIGQDVFKYLEEDKDTWSMTEKTKAYPSVQYIPVAGKFLYNWFGGGMEKWNDAREREQNKQYNWNK